MNRGYAYIDTQPKGALHISTRKQRIAAVKAVVAHLERIRDAERRQMGAALHATGLCLRCESELVASIIDEAIFVLDTIQ
jgi:endonuclease/exonuclease/phosphatase family metal-dependent hydrolase